MEECPMCFEQPGRCACSPFELHARHLASKQCKTAKKQLVAAKRIIELLEEQQRLMVEQHQQLMDAMESSQTRFR